MKNKITVVSCLVLGLSFSSLSHAGTNRSEISRGGMGSHSGRSIGGHSFGSHSSSHNKEFSVGYSGERSNEKGSITHEGSTSNQPFASFHEGTTTITTQNASLTHDGTTSKNEGVMSQHQGSTHASTSDGSSSASHHANTSTLTQPDGTKKMSHSGSTEHDEYGHTVGYHSGTTTSDSTSGIKEHDGQTEFGENY